MKNFEVARQFELMADILELKGENPFRIRAYRRAAQNLESLSEEIEAVAREERLEDIPGIGADLAGKIQEYLRTGKIKEIAAASKGIPRGVVELMNIPGVGPRTARLLHEREHITGIGQLEKLASKGGLRGLPGIQAKTEQNILKGIRLVRGGQERMPLGHALPLGRELVQALEGLAAVKQISLAGSIRRMKETVGDIDILVTSSKPDTVMRAFVALPQVAEVLERGTTKSSMRHREGIQVDLRVVEPACFGAALVYFTGSKQHNIHIRDIGVKRGLKISEYGVFRASTGRRLVSAAEAEVYAAIGLPWIPPELREDAGEIEAARQGKLPDLVELDGIRGDLHCHTDATDGHHPIEALVTAAERRGYKYVAVTDHSLSARVAGGLTADELAAHVKKIRAVQARHPRITVLAGSECDILADGSLDYPDHVLAGLDLVIGAVHTGFRQSRAEMTRRICRALAHPRLHVLGHPTGRLIGKREPYAVDIDEMLRTARRHGKAVEINSQPDRLDLDDVHARRAHELGVLVAVSTDMHMLDHLGWMELGVATARRGWTETRQVVNTWPPQKLLAWLRAERAAPARRAHGR
ncbi:MAG TPA: DNA polymerase/3'-5' exonuclease PolX [Candidatus Deferrimicrobiaceae bacterium]|nr:DNA polymerase/3'-5' exonuclease PolX [Candidatus Deferrimicrobiaceae bacterium]